MSRRKVRPIGRAIPYTIPGHVIGGSEPKSWKVSKQAEKRARLARNRKSTRPQGTGPTMDARFASECHWCGKPVSRGERIAAVRVGSRTRWIHEGCAA